MSNKKTVEKTVLLSILTAEQEKCREVPYFRALAASSMVPPGLSSLLAAFFKNENFQNVARESLCRTKSQNVLGKSVKKQQKPSNTINTS